MNQVRSEDPIAYSVGKTYLEQLDNAVRLSMTNCMSVGEENKIIKQALDILHGRLDREGALTSPDQTRNYLSLKYGQVEHELFGIIMMDNRNQILGISEMFRGTIDGASVYPREVVKEVLHQNAAAVILFHNHPSGVIEESQADIRITERLKKALNMIDVRVLDHVIVGGANSNSLAEKGLV